MEAVMIGRCIKEALIVDVEIITHPNPGEWGLKWKEFESRYPKGLYTKLRGLCEEVHRGSGFFCNYCYKQEGWFCFPCTNMRKLYEERTGESWEKLVPKRS